MFCKYLVEEKKWVNDIGVGDNFPARAYGEAIMNLCEVVELFKHNGLVIPDFWLQKLREAVDFMTLPSSLNKEGVFPTTWLASGKADDAITSAAGVPCVIALVKASVILEDEGLLEAAKRILGRYWKICGDEFNTPFARATLDAQCEDKEAGMYFFLAAYEMYRITGDARYRQWTEVAADWIITFVYHWHTGFRKGSICERNDFITTGWSGVSVQNHHLDVFFPAYELHDFGCKTGNERYRNLGKLTFNAWSHGIARYPGDWEHKIPGEQGEQFFQTNFYQGPFDENAWRGGYNPWNPGWIVAIVLKAALKFKYHQL